MQAAEGVKFLKHPNPLIESGTYSRLLTIEGLELNMPEVGKEVSIFAPEEIYRSKRRLIDELTGKIGFNGINAYVVRKDEDRKGYLIKIILDPA